MKQPRPCSSGQRGAFALGAAASTAAAHGIAGAPVSVWPVLLVAVLAAGLHRLRCNGRPAPGTTLLLQFGFQAVSHVLMGHHHGAAGLGMLVGHATAAVALTVVVHAVEVRLWALAVFAVVTEWIAVLLLLAARPAIPMLPVARPLGTAAVVPLPKWHLARLPLRRGPPSVLLTD